MPSKKKMRVSLSDGERLRWEERRPNQPKNYKWARPRLALRPSTKRWSLEDLYLKVVKLVLEYGGASRERLSDDLRAKPGLVHQCLQRMIREGYKLREYNDGPHDTKRERFGNNTSTTGWAATIYYLEKEVTPQLVG